MPVTLTFNKVSEKKPRHGEEIIWLQYISSFDSWGFEPRQSTVHYVWEEVDGDGYLVGNGICYDGESEEDMDGFKLEMEVAGCYLEDNHLWMYIEDYWNALED